jgi:hypothetical protein
MEQRWQLKHLRKEPVGVKEKETRKTAEQCKKEGECKETKRETRWRSSNTRDGVIERNCTGG